MEISLYGDQEYGRRSMEPDSSVQQLKRRLTLDLETAGPAGKRPRASHLLTSPDLKMLKLGSPELERLIAQQGGGLVTTPTPGGPQVVSSLLARSVTEEQEDYARGFVDALHSLKARDVSPSSSSSVYHNLETRSHRSSSESGDEMRIKEEPQRAPAAPLGADSPPLQLGSPLDLAHQDVIKLERKRMRNRVAATKCRLRKLERIARLEDRVAAIRNDNAELSEVVHRLREQVAGLQQEVREHTQHGCQIMYPQQC